MKKLKYQTQKITFLSLEAEGKIERVTTRTSGDNKFEVSLFKVRSTPGQHLVVLKDDVKGEFRAVVGDRQLCQGYFHLASKTFIANR